MPTAKKKTEDAPSPDAPAVPDAAPLASAETGDDVAPDSETPVEAGEPENSAADGASDGLEPVVAEEMVQVSDPCALCYPKGWEKIGEAPGVRATCAHGFMAEYGTFVLMTVSEAQALGFEQKD